MSNQFPLSERGDNAIINMESGSTSLITNLVAGIGDGGWTSRAGVVINQNPIGVPSSQNATNFNKNINSSLPFSNNQFAVKSVNHQNILLSPQHFIMTTTSNLNQDSGGSGDGNSPMPNANIHPNLMNLDISANNFAKVVNFDDLIEDTEKSKKEDLRDDMYEEQSLASDVSSDILDDQVENPKEQLMERFKQLRQWQAQQQEILMRQQQQQLEALREDQERVQRMIGKQRETQIGNINPQHYQQSAVQHLPPMSPNKYTKAKESKNSLQNVVNGPVLMARDHHKPGQRTLQNPYNSTAKQESSPQRPMPNLPSQPSTPSEYRIYGNPNLDSDTASICTTYKDIDEGVQPLPDTASESSEVQLANSKGTRSEQGQNSDLLKKFSAGNQDFPRKILTFDDTDTESQPDLASLKDVNITQTNSLPNGLLSQNHSQIPYSGLSQQEQISSHIPPGFVDILSMPAMVQSLPESMLQQLISLQQQGQTVIVDGNGQMVIYPMPAHNARNYKLMSTTNHNVNEHVHQFNPSNQLHEHINDMDGDSEHEKSGNHNTVSQEKEICKSGVIHTNGYSHPVKQVTEFELDAYNHLQHSEEETDLDDTDGHMVKMNGEYESEGEHTDINDEQEYEGKKETTCLDDIPVAGIGTKKKTFEELLEEELQREEERLQAEADSKVQPNSATSHGKKHFLKRGQGLARYSGPVKRPTKPDPGKRKTSQAVHGPSKASTGSANRQGTTSKKTESTRKTAPLKTKQPQEKLKLKPSPKKQPLKDSSNRANNQEQKTKLKASVPNNSNTLQLKSNKKSELCKAKTETKKSKVEKASAEIKDESVISAGEISFQNRLKELAENEVVEVEELQEFEILEQFADDNVSFLSNVSVVNRALTKKKEKVSRPLADVKDEEDETLADEMQSEEEELDDTINNTLVEHKSNQVEAAHTDVDDYNLTVSHNPVVAKLQSLKTIQRKIITKEDKTEKLVGSKHLLNVQQFSESDSDSESKKQTVIQSVTRFKQNHRKALSDEDDSEHSGNESEGRTLFKNSVVTLGKHPNASLDYNKSKKRISDEQKINKEKVTEESESSLEESEDDPIGFGDEETWEDASKDEDDWEAQFMKSKAKRKSNAAFAETKVPNEGKDVEIDGTGTPPTSKLITKLFPKLKQEKPKITKQQEQKLDHVKHVEVGDGVQSKLLRDKLAELEKEIERFRAENATLENLRKEREEGLVHLKREMNEFQKQKDEELKRIQEYKIEETRKLKREKKVFEDYQKTMRTMPNKKEREEIEILKQQISDLQDEMKRKEQRWTSSTTRLRDRIEQLEQENTELRDEVKVLEKRRLENWQRREGNHPSTVNSKHNTSNTTDTTTLTNSSGSQLKKSNAGPHLSTKVAPQLSTKLPQPQKQLAAKPTIQRDHDLRLSTTAEVMKISSDAMSEGSENIHPEDSASNILSRMSKDSNPSQLKINTLKTSQESSKSDEANNNSRKAITRKKTVAMSISNAVEKGDGRYEEIQHTDGKVERIYTNGAREILFSNGTRKQVSADGQSIIVSFFNGDIKQILPDQRVVYYYSDAQTTHTTYPDGLEILQFPNQQIEKHYPDGTKEITFPDQTVKYLFPNGIEESIFHDGTVIRVEKNGDKTMEFPNGQREVHTGQYKRREYPDGTVKTVYPDGRQETRYSSGRIRVKDKDGTVIVDKRV